MKSQQNRRFYSQLFQLRGFATATLALLLLAAMPMGGSVAIDDATSTEATDVPDAAMFDSVQDVIDKLQQLINDLEKANNEIQGDISLEAQSIDENQIKAVNMRLFSSLNAACRRIDDLLNPLVEPSLDPVDAGSVEAVIPPTTLIQYASTTLGLAHEAMAAATTLGQPLRDEMIGSKLKTIDSLMPGYYAAAGF